MTQIEAVLDGKCSRALTAGKNLKLISSMWHKVIDYLDLERAVERSVAEHNQLVVLATGCCPADFHRERPRCGLGIVAIDCQQARRTTRSYRTRADQVPDNRALSFDDSTRQVLQQGNDDLPADRHRRATENQRAWSR